MFKRALVNLHNSESVINTININPTYNTIHKSITTKYVYTYNSANVNSNYLCDKNVILVTHSYCLLK